jgi:5'-methylthioadenosine phosphorylase
MIGIIGGSGVYDISLLENVKEVEMKTPFGEPSSVITIGEFQGKNVAFLSRHGKTHSIAPHKVNYRANIWALKELGVKVILAPCAVGSMKEEIKAGDFVFVDQFIDRTYGRETTFYDNALDIRDINCGIENPKIFNKEKVCHISVAEPCCERVRKLLIETAQELNLNYYKTGTYICVNGPRFSTKAESNLFQKWGTDVIGMTMVPESVLAREAEICYVSIAMVTDYDCWKDKSVSMKDIIETVKANSEKSKNLLMKVIPKIIDEDCSCHHALDNAIA